MTIADYDRPEPDVLLLERDGPILTVTLNREARGNALSTSMHDAFAETWTMVKNDPTICAIIITGAGSRSFCTGMDVKDNAARGSHRPRDLNKTIDDFTLTPTQRQIWIPVIVAVNGLCVSGGLHFLCDADVIIASTNASFFDTHCIVGQVAALEPIGLVPRIGLGNALRMVLMGKEGRLSAEDALKISLVDEVVEPDQLMARAKEVARIAVRNSKRAQELSKEAIWKSMELPMRDALQNGWELLQGHWPHPDCKEGPCAYAEKREPRWVLDESATQSS